MTEFWDGVKDAHPVFFTFIRDGVPLYDRGTFLPWKSLLRMGKIKPSPEAIDMFMSMGDKTIKAAKRNLLDIVVKDLYWGVITPAQALLMLNGSPPPAPKFLVRDMKKEFVEKEKMLKVSDIEVLDKIVKIYKDYEHEKVSEVKPEKTLRDLILFQVEEELEGLVSFHTNQDDHKEWNLQEIYESVTTIFPLDNEEKKKYYHLKKVVKKN